VSVHAGHAAVTEFLEREGVAYEVVEHERTESAAAEARAAGMPPADVAKTVVLRDDEGIRLAVIPASHRLDMHKVKEELGSKGLRLGPSRRWRRPSTTSRSARCRRSGRRRKFPSAGRSPWVTGPPVSRAGSASSRRWSTGTRRSPDIPRPRLKAARAARVDAEVVSFPLGVRQREGDPTSPGAQALLVELDDAGRRLARSAGDLRDGLGSAVPRPQRRCRRPGSWRRTRARR
jgi:hypothetical protein